MNPLSIDHIYHLPFSIWDRTILSALQILWHLHPWWNRAGERYGATHRQRDRCNQTSCQSNGPWCTQGARHALRAQTAAFHGVWRHRHCWVGLSCSRLRRMHRKARQLWSWRFTLFSTKPHPRQKFCPENLLGRSGYWSPFMLEMISIGLSFALRPFY